MSDLEEFRDHAHTMAALTEPITRMAYDVGPGGPFRKLVVVTPVPTDPERALWAQIAGELDAYLADVDEPPLLWGGDPA